MPARHRRIVATVPRPADRPCRGHQGDRPVRAPTHRPGPIKTGTRHGIGAAEVHRAVALVGGAVREQPSGQRDHLIDIVAATGLVSRSGHPKLGHVSLEAIRLLHRQRPPRHTSTPGLDEEMIIDVGHIATHLDRRADETEHPSSHVGPHEGGRVTDMGRLVRRDPAHVHPGVTEHRQPGVADAERRGRAEGSVRRHRLRRSRRPRR